MRLRKQPRHGATAPIVTLVFAALIAFLPALAPPGSASAQDDAGLLDESTYESPQFGYTLAWDDSWSARQRDLSSNSGGFDVITIRGNGGTLRVAGRADDVTAAEFLQSSVDLITRNATTSDVIAETAGDVPAVELTADRNHLLLEAHTLPDNGAVVVLTLTAPEAGFADALAATRQSVTLNDDPVFAATPEATSEATPANDSELATPAPAITTPAVVTDESATPPADQAATPDDASEPAADEAATPAGTFGEGIVDNTYTDPIYGFTVTWNEDIWEAESSSDDSSTELELVSATGTLYIWAGNFYNGRPDHCLEMESEYYLNEDPGVSDYAPAENADGEPIAGETDTSAYGVFTLTYTDQSEDNAESVDLVDYLECRELVPGEADLIILATSPLDQYNDHIDDALTITNQIELAGEDEPATGTPEVEDPATPEESPDATAEPTEEPTAETTPEGSTGIEGATFTSPAFGFTLDIPSGWTVEDESLAGDDERLVLSNGISTITLHATDAYAGDLEGCVDFARDLAADDPAFADLELDETADGDPFEGSDSDSAYANFVYTGEDDAEFAYFVQCRYIVEDESVLILTQDVPYDQYATQRQARRQIENAITLAD